MSKNALTSTDIMELISDYKSEIRKLNAKISFCESRILELEEALNTNKVYTTSENYINFSHKPGRQRRREINPRKPYPLSDWDKIILDIISESGKAQLSKDIYEKAFAKSKEVGIFIDEIKSKAKINQCLVKLTNRRNDLKKVKYGGRGFAYCLPEWINENGILDKEYIKFE
jgi:hypothetical protein